MRSIRSRRHLGRLGYAGSALAIGLVLALFLVAQVRAAPLAQGGADGAWQTVSAPSLAGQRITVLLPAGDNEMWVGTEEQGLARWDGQTWHSYGIGEGLPDNRVVALFLDRQQRLWVSTGTGLGYFPADGGQFRRVSLKGMPMLPVLALAQADDGGILLGGPAGLAVWQADGGLQRVPELAGKRVLALQTGRDGATWVGTSGGLWRGAGGGWERVEGAGSDPVVAISESPDRVLHLFTQAGVRQLKAGAWRQVPTLKPGSISAAAVHDGTLWLGGLQGITAGQGDVWQTYNPRPLPSPAVTALVWDGGGRLWLGTTDGLAQYQPDSGAPAITIKSINGVSAAGTVELRSDRVERIELGAADQTTPPDALRIFVRLDGVDQAPRLLTPAEQRDLGAVAIYAGTPLAAGTYVLRAWAQDEAFNRSPESQVAFTVPNFARGPGGLVVRRGLAYAAFGGLALVVTAGATTTAATRTRRRQAARAAEAAAGRVRAASNRSGELYTAMLPLREQDVQEVTAALQTRGVLLIGEPGIGKTATLNQVASALSGIEDTSRIFVPAVLDLAAVSENDVFHALLAAASDALHPLVTGAWPRLAWNDGNASGYGEQEFSSDLGLLLAWLQPQLTRRLNLVFLLDNAGLLDGYAARHRDAFRRLILATSSSTSSVRLLLAAERIPDTLQDFADLFQTVQLAPLGQAAALQLLRVGARGLIDWDPEAEQLVLERTGGNPAALGIVGHAAAQVALANNRLLILAADVP